MNAMVKCPGCGMDNLFDLGNKISISGRKKKRCAACRCGITLEVRKTKEVERTKKKAKG